MLRGSDPLAADFAARGRKTSVSDAPALRALPATGDFAEDVSEKGEWCRFVRERTDSFGVPAVEFSVIPQDARARCRPLSRDVAVGARVSRRY